MTPIDKRAPSRRFVCLQPASAGRSSKPRALIALITAAVLAWAAALTVGCPGRRPVAMNADGLGLDLERTVDSAADARQSPDTNSDTRADKSKTDTVVPPTYVSIPAGTFVEGFVVSATRQVTLTHGFEISDHEVTQGEFQALMGYNPSCHTSCGTNCPVANVIRHEAAAYCNALSAHKGLAACYACSGSRAWGVCVDAPAYAGQKIYVCPGYRLPTNAEWEYAYRAGTTTDYYNGPMKPHAISDCEPNADVIGWYRCNSGYKTHPVKQKMPNAWGLYDMAGNVAEVTHDTGHDIDPSPVTDPVNNPGFNWWAERGGDYDGFASDLTAISGVFGGSNCRLGFRCCRTLSP